MKIKFLILLIPGLTVLSGCNEVIECLPNVSFKLMTTKERNETYDCYRMNTTFGDIDLAINKIRAPLNAENFAYYAGIGHYDRTIFHRVVRNFVIQGGGVTADLDEKLDGLISPVENESGIEGALSNQRCSVAAARKPDPDSAQAQFFINVVDNSRTLDFDHTDATNSAGYTVIGHVVNGMGVVDQIRDIPTYTPEFDGETNFTNVPRLDIFIDSMRPMACNDLF